MIEKKNISIIITILREEIAGYKDIDHILPFLYFLDKTDLIKFNAQLIIFENKDNYLKNLDPRVKLLLDLKNVDLKFLYKDNLLVKIKHLLELKNNSNFANFFNYLVNKFYFKFLKIRQKKITLNNVLSESFINSSNPFIITLHTNNKTNQFVSSIKKINPKTKWIALPHGTVLADNNMVLDTDLDKKCKLSYNEKYNIIDHIMFTSERDLKSAISHGLDRRKGFVIGSLRYCEEWLKVKTHLKLDGKDVSIKDNYKIKILFLIPKRHINIFTEELIRTIDFISSYQEIELILLNYNLNFPKLPSHIADRINIRNYVISKEYSTSKLIDWADIVFHAGTGVLFESFVKEKITVFPRYLTSNTLICDKYNAGYNLSNRDELRNFCNEAVSSLKNLRLNYKNKCNHSNKKYIDDFVNANLTSLSSNFLKILSRIINGF